jgi:NAD(P)-dependent dehydrogenase (short-subunit alcohol dehydrogenase family)
MTTTAGVLVVTGSGGMGTAVVRRIGSGSTVVLVDCDAGVLSSAARSLSGAGYDVVEHVADISDEDAVEELAAAAARRGRITAVVHTAGVSPVQAPVERILEVDLLGVALVLDAFGSVVGPGAAGVVIASMSGAMARLDPDLEALLVDTPTDELLALPQLRPGGVPDAVTAYRIAKRANQLRVRSASLVWGRRGARVNSVSPGVISTPMGAAELAGPNGDSMRAMIAGSGTGRVGTPDDIAAAVEFLTGPTSTFVTGTDLLVDGGVVASRSTTRR